VIDAHESHFIAKAEAASEAAVEAISGGSGGSAGRGDSLAGGAWGMGDGSSVPPPPRARSVT